MADLSAYIDFSISLNKGNGTSSMVLTDPNNYPVGVDTTFKGYFVITQPDGLTLTGNFISPDIYAGGGGLVDATKQLRLKSNGGFQQGEYSITYHAIALGYNETTLSKTFDINYTTPTLTITDDSDVFTPALSLTDETIYTAQEGVLISTIIRQWEATIISVEGTNQDISASSQTFDLAYLGSYYDSRYDVSLSVTAYYILHSPNEWVSIVDIIPFTHTYYAFIPPTIAELLEMLTSFKATVDAAHCICGSGCVDNCTPLKNTYSLAVSIYTHIVERGRAGETTGLDAYVIQLQKVLSNCVTPAYTNTNEAIPPY